jgi:hypothetical protein
MRSVAPCFIPQGCEPVPCGESLPWKACWHLRRQAAKGRLDGVSRGWARGLACIKTSNVHSVITRLFKTFLLAYINCTGGFTVTFPYMLTMCVGWLHASTILPHPHLKQLQQASLENLFYTIGLCEYTFSAVNCCCCFETWSHYVAQTGLEFSISCPWLPSAGIPGVHHHNCLSYELWIQIKVFKWILSVQTRCVGCQHKTHTRAGHGGAPGSQHSGGWGRKTESSRPGLHSKTLSHCVRQTWFYIRLWRPGMIWLYNISSLGTSGSCL